MIVHSNIHGLYQIPGYPDYYIDINGSVVSGHTLIPLKPHSHGGYFWYTVYDEFKISRLESRHRLMMITFNPPDSDLRNLQVNHINGIKGDDRLDNLEWCDQQANTVHAVKLGLMSLPKSRLYACRPIEAPLLHYSEYVAEGSLGDYSRRSVQIMNSITGHITTFPSAKSCADALGVHRDTIMYRVRLGGDRVWPDGYQFRLTSGEEWTRRPDAEYSRIHNKYGCNNSVVLRNIFYGWEFQFDTQRQMCTWLNVSEGYISTLLSRNSQPLHFGGHIIKRMMDNQPWRDMDLIQYYNEIQSRIVLIEVYDIVLDKLTIYEGYTEAHNALNLNRTTIGHRCNHSPRGSIFDDRYMFGIYPSLTSSYCRSIVVAMP